jgi:hypothetical protein
MSGIEGSFFWVLCSGVGTRLFLLLLIRACAELGRKPNANAIKYHAILAKESGKCLPNIIARPDTPYDATVDPTASRSQRSLSHAHLMKL